LPTRPIYGAFTRLCLKPHTDPSSGLILTAGLSPKSLPRSVFTPASPPLTAGSTDFDVTLAFLHKQLDITSCIILLTKSLTGDKTVRHN